MDGTSKAIHKSSCNGFSEPETLRTGTDDTEFDLIEANSEAIDTRDQNEWNEEEETWSGRVDLNPTGKKRGDQ